MRSGEILALTWPNIHLAEQFVHLSKTKNGDERDVPLSKRAVEILKVLPLGFGPAFALDDGVRDPLWRRVRRSEERRGGEEWGGTLRSRWSPEHLKKQKEESKNSKN